MRLSASRHATRRTRFMAIAPFLMGLALAAVFPSLCAAGPRSRSLSLEERVAAQRAIEQVYWNHRIWPKENPGPKPALSVVLPDAAIRARVEDTLRKSNALEKLWHRAITAEQLQAEMNRMAAHTRDPQLLGELFAALGNDPRLIAETLARQTLVDRLLRSWYANDARFHGELKKSAEGALAACRSVACMPSMGGRYGETTWKREDTAMKKAEGVPEPGVIRLDGEQWTRMLRRVMGRRGGESESIASPTMGGLDETAEAFVVTAVLARSRDEIRTATVTWPKHPFDEWWRLERTRLGHLVQDSRQTFALPASPTPGCVADTWDLLAGVPVERQLHTAVWTGTEMIVWGGHDGVSPLSTGGRYDPSTDSWRQVSTGANVPAARYLQTAVWTGTEMIVWGGYDGGTRMNSGGRYDPSTDSWRPTSTGANVPSVRTLHAAVWTGTEMIVWGGIDDNASLNTGGRYDPSTDSWMPTSTDGVPVARHGSVAVWTGTEMIVWGGFSTGNGFTNTGGRYDPFADAWTPTSTPEFSVGLYIHTAVWTGAEMIIWGGVGVAGATNDGGRYDPSADTWTPTSHGTGTPRPRYYHTALWTGSEMIVWGGYDGNLPEPDGGRYDPSTDSWTPTSTEGNVPGARLLATAVWTGTEMIVWGGTGGGGTGERELKSGGRYDPSTDTWTTTSVGENIPDPRSQPTAVWTGTDMIVWGGNLLGGYLNTGGRYTPSTDTWTPTSMGANVPDGRFGHTAAWTGTEMIVWGGWNGLGNVNTGGRYNPSAETWAPTSSGTNVPDARSAHTAVWTGTTLIVWGGADGDVFLNSGGRYDPSTDAWEPTSTGANVPIPRVAHAAVWTGTEMIVWGGIEEVTHIPVNTGGRYDPATDTWTPTSTGGNAPIGHWLPTAVWTGTEMIVWGGFGDSGYLNTGGRYNPSTDAWLSTSMDTNVPAARDYHTAVWTGAEMIVWGGLGQECVVSCCDEECNLCSTCTEVLLATGGRYNPSTDTWDPTSTGANLPHARSQHVAIWTGTSMIVWGGSPQGDGGRYCACPNGALSYRDADGDGYGSAGIVATSCDGAIPAGYVANQADCNDGSASVHPGALELCNAVDDDCNGTVDDAVPPGALPSVTLRSDAPVIEWTPLATAQSYDVVYGDIATLRSSGGGFTVATRGCIAAGTASTAATFITAPAPGEAFWIVARGDNCAGAGTYDSGAPSQVGSRDAGIDASPYSCGFQAVCGDGACSPTEGCADCPSDCGACQCADDSQCQPASCCNPTSCIPIWEPQSCNNPTCSDGCWICLSGCACQDGACVAVF